MMYDDSYHPTFHSGVVFANRFFVIGNSDDGEYNEIPAIWSSADGLTWERADVPDLRTVTDLVPGPGALLAVGDSYEDNTPLWLTTNGDDWQRVDVDMGGQRITRAGATQEGFVAFAGSLWTSLDGMTWQESSSQSGFQLASLGVQKAVRDDDVLVALTGGAGTGRPVAVWTSTNLVDWTKVNELARSRSVQSLAVAVGPLGWVIAGSVDPDGNHPILSMWISDRTLSWEEVAAPVGPVTDLFMDDAGLIAVGYLITATGCAMDQSEIQGYTWTSLDGRAWSQMPKTDFVSRRIDQLFRNGRTLIGLGLVYDYDAGLYGEGTVWTFRLPPIEPSGPGPTPAPTPTPGHGGCG